MEIKIFFDHDKEGHITSVNKPGERITGYAYDNNYNLTGITDPKGYLYQRSYDKDDRLVGTKNPCRRQKNTPTTRGAG